MGAEEEEEQAKEKGGQTPTMGRSRGGRCWSGPRTDGGVARADVGRPLGGCAGQGEGEEVNREEDCPAFRSSGDTPMRSRRQRAL